MRTKKQIEAWLRSDEPWVDQKREGGVAVDYFYGFRNRVMRIQLLERARKLNTKTWKYDLVDGCKPRVIAYKVLDENGWVLEHTTISAMTDKFYEQERR